MIKIISHRGNLLGKNEINENKTDHIDKAINKGFDVEIDLWLKDSDIYLGHDKPIDKLQLNWIENRSKKLWVHCKNIEIIDFFVANKIDLNFFFHQEDDLTLTSKSFLWVYPGKPFTKNAILVTNKVDDLYNKNEKPYGVCTDFPILFKDKFEN